MGRQTAQYSNTRANSLIQDKQYNLRLTRIDGSQEH